MKYEIKGLKKAETIKRFEIEGDKLILEYLDGHSELLSYSKEIENFIIHEMMCQAKIRDKLLFDYDYNDKLNNAVIILHSLLSISYLYVLYIEGHITYGLGKLAENYSFWFESIFTASFLFWNYYRLSYKQELNDFKKYHTFLDNIDLLNMNGDAVQFNGINLKEVLSINTLDSYTLSEVKDMIEILKNGKSNGKTLLKK